MTALDESERALSQANALLDLRRFADAQRLTQSVSSQVSDPRWLTVLARAYLGQNDYGRAVDAARTLIQSDPENEAGYRFLSIALVGLGRGPDAVQAAEGAVRLAPNNWAATYTMARALICAGRAADAIDWAVQARKQAPGLADPHVLLGLALVQNGRHEEGRRSFERALRINPEHEYALQNLANLEAKQGRLRSAGRLTRAGLGAAPQARGLHAQYDFILRLLLRRMYLVALPFGAVLLLTTHARTAVETRPIIGTMMLVAMIALAHPVISALPGSRRTAIARILRQSGVVPRLLLALLLVVLFGALIVAFAPEGTAKPAAGIALAIFRVLVLVMFVVVMIQRAVRRRRDAP